MATTVAQGASATVSLPAGSNIAVTGTGFAVMGPGRLQGTQYGLLGTTKVGPFDAAQTVYLTATTTALSYDIAPGYGAALPVITQRSASTGAPSGLIDPATGQPLGGGGGGGNSLLGEYAAALGNSVLVAGNVSKEPGATTYTNRSVLHWINAACGRPFRKIYEYGRDGLTSTQLLATYLPRALAGPQFDVMIVCGWLHNNIGLGLPSQTSVNDAENLLKAMGARPVLWLTDPLMDFMSSASQREHWREFMVALTNLQGKYPNLVIAPCHEAFQSKDNSVSQATKSYSSDGVHPTAVGGVRGMLPGAQRIIERLWPAMSAPVESNNDPACVTFNPFLKGSNADGGGGGPDYWYRASAAATGPGPNGFFVQCTGAGAAVAVSKVAHPVVGAAWDYGEPARSCTKLSMTTGAGAQGYFEFGSRDHAVVPWSSGLSMSGNFRLVKPTVQNGCLYRVTVDGSLASGSDPTGTWPNTPGSTFVSGTAGLTAILDPRGRKVEGVFDIYPDQTAFAGKFTLSADCRFRLSSVNATGTSSAFFGLPNTIPTPASFGNLGGLDWLPPRLHVHTQYSPDEVVGDFDSITSRLMINLDVSSRLDIVIAHAGMYVVRDR